MFKGLSKTLVSSALDKDIVKQSDVENYTYGINAFLSASATILTAIVIGISTHMLFEIVLHLVVYKLLRKYVGGSHASTSWRCYISSCITFLVVLFIIKHYSLSDICTTCIALTSGIIMFLLSPVDALKKPLDDMERIVFRRRARTCIVVCACISIGLEYAFFIPYAHNCSVIIAITMATVTIFAITGKLKLINTKKPLGELSA